MKNHEPFRSDSIRDVARAAGDRHFHHFFHLEHIMSRRNEVRSLIDGDTAAVYVVSKNDVEVKIGVSRNVGKRALGLQTSNSSELNIFWAIRLDRPDAYRLETAIHTQLRRTLSHLRGEWYAMAPETAVNFIKNQIKKLQLKTIVDLNFGYGKTG